MEQMNMMKAVDMKDLAPWDSMRQQMKELEQLLEQTQQRLAEQFYLEKRHKQLIQEAEDVIKKRKKQAESTDGTVAALAVQDQREQEKQLRLYKERLTIIRQQSSMLCDRMQQLKEKRKEFAFKQLLLATRKHAMQALQQNQVTFVSLADGIR